MRNLLRHATRLPYILPAPTMHLHALDVRPPVPSCPRYPAMQINAAPESRRTRTSSSTVASCLLPNRAGAEAGCIARFPKDMRGMTIRGGLGRAGSPGQRDMMRSRCSFGASVRRCFSEVATLSYSRVFDSSLQRMTMYIYASRLDSAHHEDGVALPGLHGYEEKVL
jgi:hypothetical protein